VKSKNGNHEDERTGGGYGYHCGTEWLMYCHSSSLIFFNSLLQKSYINQPLSKV